VAEHRVKDYQETNAYGNVEFTRHRDYWVDRAPHGDHPFQMFTQQMLNFFSFGIDISGNRTFGDDPGVIGRSPDRSLASGDFAEANNKAYGKFVDRMKDSATNANNALEMGQNANAIISKVSALTKAAIALKHGDLPKVSKALGLTNSGNLEQRIKRRGKQAADAWLEYHFGWEPLVQDIGSSIDVLQGSGKASTMSTSVSSSHSVRGQHNRSLNSHTSFPTSDTTGSDRHDWTCSVKMRGEVKISNPNVAIANQMGFVNPLSVAWEAVPFSFVVDWFANVGQCLSAMTDFAGFSVTRSWTTDRLTMTRSYTFDQMNGTGSEYHEQYSSKYFSHSRGSGVASPTLNSALRPIGVIRGATAISLLVQQLKSL